MIGAEPDRMNRDSQLPELRDGVAIHSAGIIATISQEYNRSEWYGPCLRGDVAKAVADTSGAIGSRDLADAIDSRGIVPEFVEADLEFLFQRRREFRIQKVGGLADSRGTRIGDAHAAGVIYENSDNVLLRAQTSDADSGAPEHKQNDGYKGALGQPDKNRTGAFQYAAMAPHVPEETGGSSRE